MMKNEGIKKKLALLPPRPGVYLMKDKNGRIIYVGKAKILKNRVRTYFRNRPVEHPRTAALIERIADFEILTTDNEIESLILEANLIKEHKPRYNVNLKDDKRYPYIKVTTNEPFPRLLVVRRMTNDNARYFGPYTNVKGMRETLKMLGRVFTIRGCNLTIPSKKKYRVCLDYFIKRCPGPCEDKIPQQDYRRLIDGACRLLEGHVQRLLEELTAQMKTAAVRQEFETAAELRDKIRAITSIQEKQKISAGKVINRDILALARAETVVSAVALQVREGLMIGRQNFQLAVDVGDDEAEILAAFIKQYYLNSPMIPKEVLLPCHIPEEELVAQWLTGRCGRDVRLVFPQRGEKQKLLQMATANARLSLNEIVAQKARVARRIPESVFLLQRDLQLKSPPRTVAAFDISNLGPSDPVGSLVFFRDGKPLKREYRRFQIKTVTGQDDYAMMGEVVTRYFSRLAEEGKDFPDLVLIDGGRGQLTAARTALESLNITDQPIIGLAKRLEEVILPGRQGLTIPRSSPSLHLLQRARDEAHRFAVTYQRQKRKKRTLRSELDNIRGVGPARRKALLTALDSVEGIRGASLDKLQSVAGIDQTTARRVYEYFHPQ
ncbi:excinuclease ABC subunit UvrC [Candidatus Zixiibacteriota bacterium]